MSRTVSGFGVGDRVQLHAATDEWMQGDRYGTVVGFGRKRQYVDRYTGERGMATPINVKLDKSGRVKGFHPEALFIEEEAFYAAKRNAHSGNMLGNPSRSGMTLREAQSHAKRLGYTIKSKTSTGEFVVSKSGERESERSYFTDDLDDAYNTMLHMSGQEHARAFRPFRGGL